jgi:regulator of RNase E activity RraA
MTLAPLWKDDFELFSLMQQRLFTAVVGDILDEMGYFHQFLPQAIRPLKDDMVVAGRAMTVLEQDIADPSAAHKPFGLMLEALDDLKPNEVYLAAGGSPTYAMWGELMSTRAIRLGAVGAVMNGCSRDTRGILELNFPTFSLGPYAQDQKPRGRVADFRCPLQIGEVKIDSGDIVFGDVDGVLIVPKAAEREALTRALEKVAKENMVRVAIERDGMSAVTALETFGVM